MYRTQIKVLKSEYQFVTLEEQPEVEEMDEIQDPVLARLLTDEDSPLVEYEEQEDDYEPVYVIRKIAFKLGDVDLILESDDDPNATDVILPYAKFTVLEPFDRMYALIMEEEKRKNV